jgi:hypothetical protein
MSLFPTFRIKTSEYNLANLRDLAGSLSQAFTSICASGAVISQFNIGTSTINNLTSNNLRLSSGASTGSVLTSLNSRGDVSWQPISQVFSGTVEFFGLWSQTQTGIVSFVKTGKNVNIILPNMVPVSNTNFSIGSNPITGLPLSFNLSNIYGATNFNSIIPILDNSNNKIGLLITNFDPQSNSLNVTFNIETATGGNFGGAGPSGFLNTTISYSTDS